MGVGPALLVVAGGATTPVIMFDTDLPSDKINGTGMKAEHTHVPSGRDPRKHDTLRV